MSSGSRAALSASLTELSDVTRGWITLCILLGFEIQKPFLVQRPLLSVILWCRHPHWTERRQQVVFLLRKSQLSLKQNRTETGQGLSLALNILSVLLLFLSYSCLLESAGLSWCHNVPVHMYIRQLFPKFVAWPQLKIVESLWSFVCCHVLVWKVQKPSLSIVQSTVVIF